MNDPTLGHLQTLEPRTRALATQLIIAVRTAGIPLIITSSKRGITEQIQLVWEGKSKTYNSKHLSGRAFDVDVAGWSRDAVPRWFWDALGNFARQLGLKWPIPDWDPGHFET